MTEELRDKYGKYIGKLDSTQGMVELRDKTGRLLGRFDGSKTYNAEGRFVGYGNLLLTLLSEGKQ